MENPEKIEIAGLKTIHKLCNFGADRNMEGCTFTEIVERMFDELAKAQAVPEGFEIGRLQDRIVELLDERQELYAQLDRTEEDSKRINFLADKNQWIANVQLPREIVERNLSSLRNAIDRAMDLAAQEPAND